MNSRTIIATSALTTLAVGVIASLSKDGGGLPGTRFLVGFGMAFFVTSAMADLGAPRFASAMALIILVATMLENVPTVLDWTRTRSDLNPTKKKNQKKGK